MLTLTIIVSLSVNILLGWYLIGLLKKFLFISENLSDLFLTVKAFQVFVKSLYSMDSYHGEPMVQELIIRIKEVNAEIENFREIFEPTIDEELEDELNDIEDEEEA